MTPAQMHIVARPCPGRAPIRQSTVLGVLNDAAHWIFATLRDWQQRSRERGELAALDDRALRDIGITRAEALYLINKPFWRE